MTKKNYVLLSCTVVLLIAIGSVLAQVSGRFDVIFGEAWSPTGLKEKPVNLKKPADSTKYALQYVPDDIVYSQIFRHLEELNKKADEDEQKGKNGRGLRDLYKDTAQLNEQQARQLDHIAAKTNRATKELDARARQIIDAVRAQTPDRKLQKGQAPPRPPQELIYLNNSRRELIVQAVGELRANLGEEEFGRFSQFVNQKIRPGIKPISGKKSQ